MQKEIISKWVVDYKEWHLAITAEKEVIDINTKTSLVPYWNNGVISYRIPRTTKRIGISTIRKHCRKRTMVIQDFVPF